MYPIGVTLQQGITTQAPAESAHSQERIARYLVYSAMYQGDQWEGQPRKGERRLTINYARAFVNKAASYLLAEPAQLVVTPRQRAGSQAAADTARSIESWLGEVADFNQLGSQDLDQAITGGSLGDSVYSIRWDKAERLPRIVPVNPFGFDCAWSASDGRTLLYGCQHYFVTPDELPAEQRARLSPEQRARGLEPLRAREEWRLTTWELYVENVLIAEGENPYGVIPYIVVPNFRLPGEFWGESDLVDIVELQQELNARVSIFSRILEVCGNPTVLITGADEKDTATLKLGPSQMWTLPEGATAEVLELLKAGMSQAHFDYITQIYRSMHDLTEMPRTSFGDSSGQAQARSGVALQIELQPLLHKLARKHGIWGRALSQRAQLALAMARIAGERFPDVQIGVAWPQVLPQDRGALVSQETALVGAGIHSVTRAMQLLNEDDPDAQLAEVLRQARELTAAGFRLGGGGAGFTTTGGSSNVGS